MYFEAFELKDAALWITFAIVHKSMYYMLLPVSGVFKGIIYFPYRVFLWPFLSEVSRSPLGAELREQ